VLSIHLSVGALLLCAAIVVAGPPELAFTPSGRGLFAFDTGKLKGSLKLDGKYMGLYPVVDAATGTKLTRPPGIFSPYRVFETNRRYGNAARDWPVVPTLLPNGAVRAHWPPEADHPVKMTAVFRWTAPDTLDLDLAVTPQKPMPNFELFMSSYFAQGFRASVYMKGKAEEPPRLVPADRTRGSRGGYVMFPSDAAALRVIEDGRWKIPPSPVHWAIARWLAAPLAIRRDKTKAITGVMMCRPGDCFAVACPWNSASPKGGGYRSLYHCLFGRDLKKGETARARMRLIIAPNLTDDAVIGRYQTFLRETSPKDPPSAR